MKMVQLDKNGNVVKPDAKETSTVEIEGTPTVEIEGTPNVRIIGTQAVKVSDIDMPFGSMIVFMVKWAIAAIPAILILMVLFFIFGGFLAAIFN